MGPAGRSEATGELGPSQRRRADRAAAGPSGGAGVSGLLLLGRSDPHRASRYPGPVVAVLPVRRSRRPRHARGVPDRRGDHPAGAVELARPRDQPHRAAVGGVTGAVARTAGHPRLAARAADAVGLRAVHTARRARVRVVGGRAELAADDRRAGVGVRRRDPAGADGQPALRGHGRGGVPCRSAVLREGGGDSVRRVRRRRTAGLGDGRSRCRADGVASRSAVVGGVAGAHGGVGRGVRRRRRPAAVELRSGHDLGPAAAVGDARHRARPCGRPVGLAALGARFAVGDAALGRDAVWGGPCLRRRWPCPWRARSASARCGWWPSRTRSPVRCRST